MKSQGYNWGGVYVFRTRRPGFLGRIPLLAFLGIFILSLGMSGLFLGHFWIGLTSLLLSPRHFAYVGEGRVRSRRSDHLKGSVKYNAPPKPWADLNPSWYFLPLPYFKPLLHTVEALGIMLLWPVYNHQKNLWNPRRIPLKSAKRQRGQRDFSGWSFNVRFGHIILWVALAAFVWQRS